MNPAWTRSFASWAEADREAPPDRFALGDQLNAELTANGAVAVGPVTLTISDSHADFFVRNSILVAEVRGLVLRHPNPFPRLRLFSWLPV